MNQILYEQNHNQTMTTECRTIIRTKKSGESFLNKYIS